MILVAICFLISGCVKPFIPIYNLKDQKIDSGLSIDQVKKAIEIGGTNSGWRFLNAKPGHMIGTLDIRTHKIIVDIFYTPKSYDITYKSSVEMKVYCNKEAKDNKIVTVTGPARRTCKGGPEYINPNYRVWVDDLNKNIELALSTQT